MDSLSADSIVYDDGDGHYLAVFGGREWVKWPATANGWSERVTLKREPSTSVLFEYDATQSRLAFRLSGAER